MTIKKRPRAPTDPLETANRQSDEDFIRNYLKPSEGWTKWAHPRTEAPYTLSLKGVPSLTTAELAACFALVEKTSSADYRASSMGWSPFKKTEMKSPDLRYILVTDESGSLRGFTSFMPTWEEGEPVIYCYEIHLEDDLRGTGLAGLLMGFLETVAVNIPLIEKVMLTCFLRNAKAVAFYKKLGFVKDAISPQERRLRGGKLFVPDYVIMSRTISRTAT
ncbi:hypothetical protein SODALDRAFT_76987 [Sodiomyces alkalinus F11]|uniref:N-alpha-acetyltransferase 40 n=1 Tax=Sodiomyces alkalinus (strain CBS 110278 / VKM F-3762 / F11) TaxID=1314773 RepID=A0A3N2PKK0_SODAK|nr:hypothetical protein SODALDRAFT_76987 [Sodiomyces alkalinus F11]ROT35043.1 hypothetical protein SODALDRAFT_76987 [Sodiomyces alkalinus F11]